MKTFYKFAIVVALGGAIVVTFALKDRGEEEPVDGPSAGKVAMAEPSAEEALTLVPREQVASVVLPVSRAETPPTVTEEVVAETPASPAAEPPAPLPRLVDLGADKCVPCKMMAPILKEIKKTYAGKFEVEFIDIWKNPAAGQKYDVTLIPTQIFYDASGKERFRHTGFFGREEILGKWKELGVL